MWLQLQRKSGAFSLLACFCKELPGTPLTLNLENLSSTTCLSAQIFRLCSNRNLHMCALAKLPPSSIFRTLVEPRTCLCNSFHRYLTSPLTCYEWIDLWCVLFVSGLLLSNIHCVWGSSLSHVAVIHSLSLLCSMPLHNLITINFPILLFIDIWVTSIWGFLWIMLLRNCPCYFGKRKNAFIPLGIFLWVDWYIIL